MLGFPTARLLPVTIGTLAVLLVIKTASLAEFALGSMAAVAPADAAALPGAVASAARAEASPAVRQPGDGKPTEDGRPQPTPSPGRGAAGPSAAVGADMGLRPDGALLLDLAATRRALDRRAAALDAREAALKAASAALDRRISILQTLLGQEAAAEKARTERDDTAWAGLVKVYEAMRPDDAATIFNGLDIETLLQLLDRMNPRKSALVLAAMLPERARVVTQMLAQRRVAASNGGALPVPAGGDAG